MVALPVEDTQPIIRVRVCSYCKRMNKACQFMLFGVFPRMLPVRLFWLRPIDLIQRNGAKIF